MPGFVQVDSLTFCFWKSRCGNYQVETHGKNAYGHGQFRYNITRIQIINSLNVQK